MVTKRKKIQRVKKTSKKVIKEPADKMIDSEEVKKKVVGKSGLGTKKVFMIANADTPKMQYAKGRIYSVDKREYAMISKSCIDYKEKKEDAGMTTKSFNVNR